ncbi:hypothetical protein CR513_60783, partial [Mucuna pruriens]
MGLQKTKLNRCGTIQKHKARLVQKIDYNETFSPIACLDMIRALIALVAKKEWSTYQLDFLHKRFMWSNQKGSSTKEMKAKY